MFLESAGRPGAAADPKLEGAVGLTQILAETGRNLLGMKIDVRASRRLTRRIARAERAGDERRARRLRARRARVDERFDPRKALEATGRYLTLSRGRFGREDLVDRGLPHGHRQPGERDPRLRRAAQLRGDLLRHGPDPARGRLATALRPRRRLLHLPLAACTPRGTSCARYRDDPDALGRAADLYTAKNSAEEVLHPEDATEVFDDPDELEGAYRDGDIRSFPQRPARARPAPRPPHGRAGAAPGARAAPVPRPAPRRLRARGLHGVAHPPRRAAARAAHGDQHGARRRVPGAC